MSSRPELPLITISVVSHGDGDALQCLLESLQKHEHARGIQLIVTDNLGQDLPELQKGAWRSVTMLRNEVPRGYASNHNTAFERAEGEYFCVLNPDVVFVESVLPSLVKALESRAADITAPLLVDSLGRVQDSFRGLPSPWEIVKRRVGASGLAPELPEGKRLHPDWVAGMFLLMHRRTFVALGGFEARYRLYFEDVDLCTRARLARFKISVETELHLRHDPRRASRRDLLYLMWHIESALRFFTSPVYREALKLDRIGPRT